MIPAIILDIVVIAIVFLLLFKGYRDGFIKTVLHLVGYVVCLSISVSLSRFLSQLLSSLFRQPMIDSITGRIAETPIGSAGASLEEMLDAIPGYLSGWVGVFGSSEEMSQSLQSAATQSAAQFAVTITDSLILPVIEGLLQLVLFSLLLIVSMILLRFVLRMARSANHIPVLGGLNRLGGAVLGLINGLLFAWAFILIAGLILSVITDGYDILERTVVLKRAYERLPFRFV